MFLPDMQSIYKSRKEADLDLNVDGRKLLKELRMFVCFGIFVCIMLNNYGLALMLGGALLALSVED